MTETEMRISIAEACGWKKRLTTERDLCFPGGYQDCNVERWFASESIAEFGYRDIDLPDYLNDLNAMHEAELWLIYAHPDLENAYNRELAKVTHGLNTATAGGQPSFYVTLLRRATAKQRCEAFLKCLGKWKD